MVKKIYFSIITPVYNGEEYIEQCILSVKNQTYKNYEHIIMDGGSTDNTVKIAKKYIGTYNLKVISQTDNGMYDAIAKGFDLSSGNVISWLNADDMYLPWALNVMAKVFLEKDVRWCIGHPGFWDENGNYRLLEFLPVYFKNSIKRGYYDGRISYNIQQESTFWTKELWNESKANEIIIKYDCAGDYYLWRLFSFYTPLYSVNSPVAGFRVHEGQKSSVQREKYYKEVGKLNIFMRILSKSKTAKILHRISSIRSKYIIRIQEI